jgi:hypothetical protein
MGKRKTLSFYEKILRIKQAGLGNNANLAIRSENYEMLPLSERLPLVYGVFK